MSNTAGFPQVPANQDRTNPNAPLVTNAQQMPYQQAGYPQPMYSPQSQPFVLTNDMKDMMGYSKALSIYALIELILFCISIVGLIFIYMPMCGQRVTKRWSYDDLHCFYIWRIIVLVLCILSLFGSFSSFSVLMTAIVEVLIQAWAFYVTYKAHNIWSKNTNVASSDLKNAYETSDISCKMFSFVCFIIVFVLECTESPEKPRGLLTLSILRLS